MLSLAIVFINRWKLNEDSQRIVLAEKKKNTSDLVIKAVKHIKKDQKDYYYFSPIKQADDFFVDNLPVSLYKKKNSDKELILVKPKLQSSHLRSVNTLTISKIVYQKKFFHLAKKSEKVISTYHVTDDLKPFQVRDLVSGHLERIQEEVEKKYPNAGFNSDKYNGLKESNSLLSDGFEVKSGNLIFDKKLTIPLTTLFDVINPDFLANSDRAAYDNYRTYKEQHPKKLVALTFDDGPDPTTTPQVLDILAKYQAKGTFFMIGSKVVNNENLTKRVSDAGHEIANHTWDHPNLTNLSVSEIQHQVNMTNQAIEKACGKKPHYLRPPYGATNATVQQSSGLTQMLWTVDTRDWENHSTDGIMTNVKNQLQPGGVVLMHDIHQTTINALPTVMEYLKAEGYECVTVSELYAHQ